MYKSFEVKNFRCLNSLSVDNLKRVNLITGLNNVGKTTLLEALFIYGGINKPELTVRLNPFRGLERIYFDTVGTRETTLDFLFNNFSTTEDIIFSGLSDNGAKRTLKLRMSISQDQSVVTPTDYTSTGPLTNIVSSEAPRPEIVLELVSEEFNRADTYRLIFRNGNLITDPTPPKVPFDTIFITPHYKITSTEFLGWFSKLQNKFEESRLIDILKIIEKDIKGIKISMHGQEPLLDADIGLKRLIPLNYMGEGIISLTVKLISIANAKNGIVLFDEIDSGLHHSKMSRIWSAILEASRVYNTQIFATTHSLECIVSAHNAFKETAEYDFSLIRLEKGKGNSIEAVTYDKDTLESAINMELEVR